MTSRIACMLSGFLIGALTTIAGTVHASDTDNRDRAFGLLARDIHIATKVTQSASAATATVSRAVDHDLHIILMRYSSPTADELRILQLTAQRADAGLIKISESHRARLSKLLAA